MPEKRSRFVLLCQQVLAFGIVAAIAAPASGVATLDIVGPAPGKPPGTPSRASGSLVASEPVAPDVHEVPITGIDAQALESLGGHASEQRVPARRAVTPTATLASATTKRLAALTGPEEVTGFATIGVTWKHGVSISDKHITVSVRSLKAGAWSAWQDVPYDSDHGPDPGSREAKQARPGTDAVVVGDVTDVQIKAVTSTGEAPPDMKLALINPGRTVAPTRERPAIDTAKLASAQAIPSGSDAPDADAALTGSPAAVTPKPKIYSRAQWGADEKMRDKSSLHYYEVHAGFVHHTVNANGYTRAQVPSILRGIYAYHTQSKGWSDIGYNFLVDRFGRIWEGRYGGVDRPVVGAHTLGYNDYAFAMSAIGNYDIYDKGRGIPSKAMLDAYGRLFAWKLSLHGVSAASTHQWVGKKYLPAINGHRDVGQTACPGRYLYAKLPEIRKLAAKYQNSFQTRERATNLSGTRWPDLVVRDKATRRVYQMRTDGQVRFAGSRTAARGWGDMDLIAATRDLTGDGIADMMGRNAKTKVTGVYPGNGHGGFGAAVRTSTRFNDLDQMVAVGDLDGDGNDDIIGRQASTKRLYLYPGKGQGQFRTARLLSKSWSGYNLTAGAGDLNGDGHADLLARGTDHRLRMFPGTGHGRIGPPVTLPGSWGGFDLIAGMGDVTNDGKADIVVRLKENRTTYIYPGNGAGRLGARFGPYSNFKNLDFLANAGQVSGNKSNDLVGRTTAGTLVVFANNGWKNLGALVDTGSTFENADLLLNVGDWNGDGHGDVMTRSRGSGSMYLHAGDGRGHFAKAVRAGRGFGAVKLLTAVGDITGDGYPDLMGQPGGHAMRIYPGNGRTGIRTGYVAHAAIGANDQVGVGLWNSDGSPDSVLRRSDGKLVVYAGNGPGGLTGGRVVGAGAGRYDWLTGVGDADGDGDPDIIARMRSNGGLWLLPGLENGTGFGAPRFIGSGFGRFDLAG